VERIAHLLNSRLFKKISLVVGSTFLFLAFFIALDPDSFLKYGYPGVFTFNLVGPGTLLIPSLSQRMNVVGVSFFSALGMALNDSVGWLVGRSSDVVVPRPKWTGRIEQSMRRYGHMAVFVLSVVPIPFDMFGIIAGYVGFSFLGVYIPAFLGKFVRFLIMGFGTLVVLKLALLV